MNANTKLYLAPSAELLEVRVEKQFLGGSVASTAVSDVAGWASAEEDW